MHIQHAPTAALVWLVVVAVEAGLCKHTFRGKRGDEACVIGLVIFVHITRNQHQHPALHFVNAHGAYILHSPYCSYICGRYRAVSM